MDRFTTTLKRAAAVVAAISAFALPLAASADVPGEQTLHGRVTAFDGHYDLHVQTRDGNVDDVRLHPGTIINPTGLTLRPGMRVTILGLQQGGSLAANEIDTPYHIEDVAYLDYPGYFYGDPYFFGGFYDGFGPFGFGGHAFFRGR